VGCLIAAVLIAPWYLLVWKYVPNGAQILIDERLHIWREGHDTKNWWFYIVEIAGGLLPWSPALLILVPLTAARSGLLRLSPADSPEGLAKACFRYVLLTGVIAYAGFFSQAKQQGYYLLPLMPALALASGYAITRCRPFLESAITEMGIAQIVLAFGLGVVLALIPLQDKAMPWVASIVLALLFFAGHVISVRYWKNNRSLPAAAAAALAAFLAMTPSATLLPARSHRKLGPIETDSPRLRSELDAMGSDVHVYGWGNPQPLLNFYLMRVVSNHKDLQQDLRKDEKESAPPRRVLVATAKWITLAGLEKYLPADLKSDDNSRLIALPLPPAPELLKVLKTPERAAPDDDDP
jgi:4-amino-4-deoxy-L-arabinose transferase-like glycosyltransferase